jgi:hypothetical protein
VRKLQRHLHKQFRFGARYQHAPVHSHVDPPEPLATEDVRYRLARHPPPDSLADDSRGARRYAHPPIDDQRGAVDPERVGDQ